MILLNTEFNVVASLPEPNFNGKLIDTFSAVIPPTTINPKTLAAVSPINLIPIKNVPACLLVCGTYDLTVECEQSKLFAEAVKQKGGKIVLDIYPFYDHSLSSKGSDKMEEIFFKSVEFIQKNLK